MPVDRSKLYNFAKQTKLPPVVTTTLPSYGKLSFGIVNSAANGKRVSFSKALAKSLQLEENGRTLVSIPATTRDVIWQTMDTADTSYEYVSSIADLLITEDGKSGQIIDVINTNGYPILITHWQSIMSNGLGTGIRVLDKVARRVNNNLADCVEWMNFEEIMKLVIANKEDYPKPKFE